jgi:hypothetical protein
MLAGRTNPADAVHDGIIPANHGRAEPDLMLAARSARYLRARIATRRRVGPPNGSPGRLLRGELRRRRAHIVRLHGSFHRPSHQGHEPHELRVLSFTIDGAVARVRLSQPDRGNPFDLRFCTELSKIATVCDVDRRVRCVLIDADGRFFSVGGDLGSLGRDRDELQTFIGNPPWAFIRQRCRSRGWMHPWWLRNRPRWR